MAKVYKKVGENLESSESTIKANIFSYSLILDNITKLENELIYWNNLKAEADILGVKLSVK